MCRLTSASFPGVRIPSGVTRKARRLRETADGKLIGAESYLLGTVELEQALTRWLSLVAFSDNLGATRRFSQYPFDETLYSVGGGLRFRTIVGPIRLEYGHNLNRRTGDPSGTVHFSLGFPF